MKDKTKIVSVTLKESVLKQGKKKAKKKNLSFSSYVNETIKKENDADN